MIIADGGYLSWVYGTTPQMHNGWTTEGRRKFSARAGCLILVDSDTSLRKQFFPGYKEARVERRLESEDRRQKHAAVKRLVHDTILPDPSLAVYTREGLEADDLVALVVRFAMVPLPVKLVGVDKDLLQLPLGSCVMERTTGERATIKKFAGKQQVALMNYIKAPEDILFWLCLMGDDSDSIPRLIPPRQLDIMADLMRSKTRWLDAHKLYGDQLLRNLYVAVLPSPWCFDPVPSAVETLHLVQAGLWDSLPVNMELRSDLEFAIRRLQSLEVIDAENEY